MKTMWFIPGVRLVREVAALRMAMGESATRDYVRGELRSTLEEIRDLLAEETTTSDTEE